MCLYFVFFSYCIYVIVSLLLFSRSSEVHSTLTCCNRGFFGCFLLHYSGMSEVIKEMYGNRDIFLKANSSEKIESPNL